MILFMVGLSKPLCGSNECYQPFTRGDVFNISREMKNVIPKRIFTPNPFVPRSSKR